MVDLSVDFAGLKLKNPFIIASSELTNKLDKIKVAEECGASAVSMKLTFLKVPLYARPYHIIEKGGAFYSPSGERMQVEDTQELIRQCKEQTDLKITTGRLVTPDSKFSIGSMNKMFTAVAVLQLVEAKKIALDDPVGKYLADYPNRDAAAKVTVRHLLTHTGHTGDIFGPEFVANRLSLKEHADYIKLFGSHTLTGEPGSGFEYSNFGFILLGAIIEKATGQTYYDYVRTNIFQPAGMKATDSLPETDNVPNRASGYRRDGSAWVSNVDTLPYRGTSAGGGYSTVGDLLRFVQALESGRLLSKTMFGEATNPQGGRYGYGFGADGEGALRSYGHNGGAPGMNGDLRVFPQLGYVVVALSNLDPPAASRLVDYFVARMPATP